MSAVDRLDDIEIRLASPMVTYKENATIDAPVLVAALRNVLAYIDGLTFKGRGAPDDMPDEVDYISDGIGADLRATIVRALDAAS